MSHITFGRHTLFALTTIIEKKEEGEGEGDKNEIEWEDCYDDDEVDDGEDGDSDGDDE